MMAKGPECLLGIIKLLRSNDKYYIPTAMDLFFDLPAPYQYSLLHFITEKNPNDEWIEKIQDSTLFLDVLRSVLFYYTGRKELGQPCKEDLASIVGEYCTTSAYKNAKAEEVSGKTESFMDLLEEV